MSKEHEHNMYDYEKIKEEFEWEVPEFYNFALDDVDERAKQNPEKTALISVDNSGENAEMNTFKELKDLSNKFANILREKGLEKGDRAMLLVHRIPEWYVAILGMIKLGVIPIPTPNLAVPEDIRYRIDLSEANTIVTDWSNHEKIDKVRDKEEMKSLKNFILIDPEEDVEGWDNYDDLMEDASAVLNRDDIEPTKSDDPLLIYFTSGTTGKPKMVLHNHSYPIGHTVTAKYVQDLTSEDTNWTIADNGWAKAVWGKLFGQWIVGATIVQQNITGKFDPKKTLKVLQDYEITTFCVPPTIYKMMINEDVESYDLSSLRHCLSAGEPLNPDVIDKWEEYTGLRIYDYYGQTETVALVANYPTMEVKAGSMGKPTPGHDVEIIDDTQNIVPVGEEGHIGLKVESERPPGLFQEYWKDEEKTREVFEGGWYYTGDRA
ncbi:MAG: acyl-CoA synthetase [Candidatus Saliniplasma sp.]